jgi:hypothetical protein
LKTRLASEPASGRANEADDAVKSPALENRQGRGTLKFQVKGRATRPDAILRERYTNDVPVIFLGPRKAAKHRVDLKQLRRQLAEASRE